MSELDYWIALNNIPGLGPRHFARLLKFFKSARRAFKASPTEWQQLGFSERLINNFRQTQESIKLDHQKRILKNLGVTVLRISDPDYPTLLKKIPDPPYLLYVRGKLKAQDELALAVVGSRRVSRYGGAVIKKLIPPLTEQGLTIVSGLALGVDALAHQTALEAGGRTIAVLASGIDQITPTTNEWLGQKIIRSGRGALVSELPLGTKPQKSFFPVRNRIISGLSLGTLVVEAANQSGTSHTVAAAKKQKRILFAVPGPIVNPLSVGPNELIRGGAFPVTEASDILKKLRLKRRKRNLQTRRLIASTPQEEKLLKIIGNDEVPLDKIIQKANLDAAQVLATLTLMEMRGYIVKSGHYYRRMV